MVELIEKYIESERPKALVGSFFFRTRFRPTPL